MVRYQQADANAAAELVNTLSRPLFHYFLSQVRDRSQADDLLQDFWLRIHKARHTYRPGEPVLPWAYAIARYTRVDHYRRNRRESHHEPLPETAAANPANPEPDLDEMLASLPESQREVIVMLKVSGLSLQEVARATGSSVGSVKQKAHRAYEKLRAVLK